MSNLINFQFRENQVRVVNIKDEPWFVGKDVCDILEIEDTSSAYRRLKDYEKATQTLYGSGQNREFMVISESGLYRLVLTSRKPQAEPFQDWICQEVVPQIRKTGSYSLENLSKEEILLKQCEMLVENKRRLEEVEKTSSQALSIAQEAKEGLEKVRDEISSLKELAIN
jgi:prophage antirepressor-like protein